MSSFTAFCFHLYSIKTLFGSGISSSNQLIAFTGCSGPASPQVDAAFRCLGRPTTLLLLAREDGKHGAASLIEALTVQLTLVGVLGKLCGCSCHSVRSATHLVSRCHRYCQWSCAISRLFSSPTDTLLASAVLTTWFLCMANTVISLLSLLGVLADF